MNKETVIVDETSEVQRGHLDPYQLDPSHIVEPPTAFGEIMRQTGPGMVLAASSAQESSFSRPRWARRSATR